jgi:outer membrane protein W
MKHRKGDYYVVDPEYGEKISRSTSNKAEYSYSLPKKNRNSYFFASIGKYQPKSTSFGYIENDIIQDFGVGFKRNDRIEVELRKMTYSQDKTGDDFFVAGSDYSFKYEPVSMLFKYKLGKHTRFKPYAAYGLSYVKYSHYLTEPGQNEIINVERSYAPCILYGVEFEEKQDFSMFVEVFTILAEKEQFRIKSRIYEIDSNNYTWSFGVKFYFE